MFDRLPAEKKKNYLSNAKIEREIEDRLNLKIEQAVKDSFAFWHRTPPGYETWLPQDFT